MDSLTNEELQERLVVAAEALHKAEEQALAGRLALELIHEIKNLSRLSVTSPI
jgi:hypothetical protein